MKRNTVQRPREIASCAKNGDVMRCLLPLHSLRSISDALSLLPSSPSHSLYPPHLSLPPLSLSSLTLSLHTLSCNDVLAKIAAIVGGRAAGRPVNGSGSWLQRLPQRCNAARWKTPQVEEASASARSKRPLIGEATAAVACVDTVAVGCACGCWVIAYAKHDRCPRPAASDACPHELRMCCPEACAILRRVACVRAALELVCVCCRKALNVC